MESACRPYQTKNSGAAEKRDMNAGEIAAEFNMTKPSISNHLNILKQADLVDSEKQGQNVVYSIKTSVIEDMLSTLSNLTKRNED